MVTDQLYVRNRELKDFATKRLKKWLPLTKIQDRGLSYTCATEKWSPLEQIYVVRIKKARKHAPPTPRHARLTPSLTPLTPASRHSDHIEILGRIASTTSATSHERSSPSPLLVTQHVGKKNTGQDTHKHGPLGIAPTPQKLYSRFPPYPNPNCQLQNNPRSELHWILVYITYRKVQFHLHTSTR